MLDEQKHTQLTRRIFDLRNLWTAAYDLFLDAYFL